MRKFLKSKDQADNNSNIFKEAKRRFHYEPPHKENKYFLHSKHKHQSTNHQFKDDFSSVKEMKMENNQINESSWIVKLVNVMHENSEQDAKANPAQEHSNNFLSLRPIQSKEIIQDHQKAAKAPPLPTLKQQSNEVTPLATKKNSINTEMMQNKKQSKSQKSQSCDTVSRRSKKNSRADTIKRNKNQVDLKRNRSQSQLKSNEVKQENGKIQMKSMKSISCSKATTDKVKNQCHSIISEHNFQSSKNNSGNLAVQSKQSIQMNKNLVENVKDSNAVLSIKENDPQQQKNFKSSFCLEGENDNILAEEIPDDLFALSTNQKSNAMKTDSHLTTQKRCYVGSIKKNKPYGSQRKTIFTPKQEEVKIHEQKLPFNKERQPIIIEKKDEDIVTARQQQHLIDKYLNNDYSFKKQSNMFKYQYTTSQFDRSLLHLNKPAICLEKPLNSGKSIIRHESYQSRKDEKNPTNLERYQEKQISKREPAKKFNYFSENAQKQTTQNSLSIEILTLRCNQQQKHHQYQLPSFSKPIKKEKCDNYTNTRQIPQFKSTNQENLRRIHEKYNRPLNQQPQPKTDIRRQQSISTNVTKRDHLAEIKPNLINRNPYLQESVYKNDDNCLPETKIPFSSNYQYPTFKPDPKGTILSRQRAQSNFNIDNLNSISRRERTDSELFSEGESEQMITRLNSKLNSYIHQYRLEKENEQPQSSRENQPTHRRINLDFNELKKHHDIFQR